MNFEGRDFRKIALGLAVMLALLAAGGAAVWWSSMLAGKAQRDFRAALARHGEADRRLREVNREEEEIRANSEQYRQLVERGIIGPEKRLDWVELIAEIRKRRRLFDIDYEFSPQSVLAGTSSPYRFSSSTMKFRLPLLHEGDLFNFLEDIQTLAPAQIQARHCTIERIPNANSNLAPHLTGSCTLQWITIQDERSSGGRQ